MAVRSHETAEGHGEGPASGGTDPVTLT